MSLSLANCVLGLNEILQTAGICDGALLVVDVRSPTAAQMRVEAEEEAAKQRGQTVERLDQRLHAVYPIDFDEEHMLALDDTARDAYKKTIKAAYETASENAKHLRPTDPIRLGLALKFSLLSSKSVMIKEVAIERGMAIEHLDELSEDEYKDSTITMQLLRDKMAVWL